ncbi:unnamed protein product [Prorocentrum cordatum]|uniref:Histidine phosphatase family protein n=1 Tax=Prorocentrum cordatum TaxID=2364126 RepID=A0ABN9QU44_9DINO|nr:unnamed protein product [Polarella glacialis]
MDDVFVTRHGARLDNGPDRQAGWMQKFGLPRDDAPLSPHGETAAMELAARMAEHNEEIPIAHVVSSPFIRCVQTASIVAQTLSLSVKVEPGICEILSTFPPGFMRPEEAKERFGAAIDLEYEPVVDAGSLSPEFSDGQAATRAARAASKVRENLGGRPGILFCGHGASCLGIVEAFGGCGYIGYCSLSRFARQVEGRQWSCVGEQGDVSHLSDKRTSLNSAF